MEKLARLGFDKWFQARTDSKKLAEHEIARVISVHKKDYVISRGEGDIPARLPGKAFYAADSPVDLPTVGDWVYADFQANASDAVISELLPRKTLLKRKASGRSQIPQLIAANIDVAFIMQSLNEDFNLRRLERYLVMVNESAILPIILLSKSDLLPEDAVAEKINSIVSEMPNIKVISYSSKIEHGLSNVRDIFIPGQTYCLLGSSGVGKTTLLNRIIGSDQYETRPVREKDSKGMHTTTRRQLIQLESGAMLIDTPGMRELGNVSADTGIDETFSEIFELSKTCKFNDCTHTHEKNCAVLDAVKNGTLSEKRFHNYLSMKKESTSSKLASFEQNKKRNRQRDGE